MNPARMANVPIIGAGWGGATMVDLTYRTGLDWDTVYGAVARLLSDRRIVAREQPRRQSQGHWVGGAVCYSWRDAA